MDTRYLEQRRQGWYAVRDVPAKLVPLVGRKRLRRTLRTRDLRVAQHRRWEVVAQFNEQITRAAAKAGHGDLLNEALEIAKELKNPVVVARSGDPDEGTDEVWTNVDLSEEIIDHFMLAARRQGYPDLATLEKVATGSATPLQTVIELWLTEEDIEQRGKGEHRLAMRELTAWCIAENLTPAVETFTRKVAGRYVTALRSGKLARGTINKRLWSLAALWRWLIAKGNAEENPWLGHGAGGGRSERVKDPERPFTDAEVAKLLTGTQHRTLQDIMRIAALSGMRLEEIALLRVADVDLKDRTMTIRSDPKTPSARRTVPIHPGLEQIITARIARQPLDAFLIAEIGPEPRDDRQRSMAISKRFGRYRQDIGVHEERPGQRRSLVNFHSFRRWFITKAEQAGQSESVIRTVVGHKRPGVTFGTYSGGTSLEQRRACVEAVRLP